MNLKQITIYGTLEEIKPPEYPDNGRRYRTMQEIYGYTEGKTCKTCKHLVSKNFGKRYYKCCLWIDSNCSATDIRLKDKACGRYEDE